MGGLFKLLFSGSYWRLVLRGDTWRSTWVAMRRVHKDRRAWRQLARALYLLLIPLSVVVLVVGIVFGAVGASPVGIALMWSFILLMGVLSRVGFGKPGNLKQPDVVQSLNLSSAEPAEPIAKITPELIQEFSELTLLHAIFAARAASERFVQTKTLPEGVDIITRRRHLDLLREHDMYGRLGATERNLLLMPDGHWPGEVVNEMSLMLEPLRLLRWVLRLDNFLPNIGGALEADFNQSADLIREASPLFGRTVLISLKDVRTALQAAQQYFYRCWAEGVRRGFMGSKDTSQEEELAKYAQSLEGKENVDFLLNATIVSKASDEDIRLATTLAQRRSRLLYWIQQRMTGEAGAAPELHVFHQLEPGDTADIDEGEAG